MDTILSVSQNCLPSTSSNHKNMICDDACNKGLVLGLGVHDIHDQYQNSLNCSSPQKKNKPCLRYDHLFPLLSLGPSEGAYKLSFKINAIEMSEESTNSMHHLQPSSSSPVSISVNGEEDFVPEEVEKVSSRVSDEGKEVSPRKKLKLTTEQAAYLEDNYKKHSTINPKQKQNLAKQLNLQPRQVEVWFQNRRARTKLKQTEIDRKLLRKCFEELKLENKRLQKELQELKSSKFMNQICMQLPAAIITPWPSCEVKTKGSSN